jgi:hypothetical protein
MRADEGAHPVDCPGEQFRGLTWSMALPVMTCFTPVIRKLRYRQSRNCHSRTVFLRASASVSGCELSLKELAMPDLDQIKQAEQGVRDRGGRFARGRSANPAGRPAIARRRGRGADPQSRRTGARRRPRGITALPRTHRRAVSRTRGRVHDAAGPQRRRPRGCDGRGRRRGGRSKRRAEKRQRFPP